MSHTRPLENTVFGQPACDEHAVNPDREPPPSPRETATAVRCAVRMLYTSLWLQLSGPGKCCSQRSSRMVYPDTARKRHNVGRP
jgi:hypothetical protein